LFEQKNVNKILLLGIYHQSPSQYYYRPTSIFTPVAFKESTHVYVVIGTTIRFKWTISAIGGIFNILGTDPRRLKKIVLI
jgi:hypothetical protein